MNLDEWELLPDEGFIDLHEDGNNFSPKSNPNTTTVIDMNYFHKFVDPKKSRVPRVIPVPIQFDEDGKIGEIPEEVTKLPIEQPETQIWDRNPAGFEPKSDDQEMVSKVFFKKLKENEFVDMKMDSPKSINRGILPPIDVGTYQFEEEGEKEGSFDDKSTINEENNSSKNQTVEEISDWEDHNESGLNIWKWAMSGMGALVSFGFAAATVSIIVLSNRRKEHNHSKNQELHFQIYSHDKRFKQVVRRAKRLNEAITVMRGAPITRAHITIGGYYEGL